MNTYKKRWLARMIFMPLELYLWWLLNFNWIVLLVSLVAAIRATVLNDINEKEKGNQ